MRLRLIHAAPRMTLLQRFEIGEPWARRAAHVRWYALSPQFARARLTFCREEELLCMRTRSGPGVDGLASYDDVARLDRDNGRDIGSGGYCWTRGRRQGIGLEPPPSFFAARQTASCLRELALTFSMISATSSRPKSLMCLEGGSRRIRSGARVCGSWSVQVRGREPRCHV